MPYVKQETRKTIDEVLRPVHERLYNEGDLNYAVTQLCLKYLRGTRTYVGYNAVIGVLECAKQEFYRRAVAKYEDEKRGEPERGDVYA